MIEHIVKKPWELLRGPVAADDTALTTFEYDNDTYIAGKYDIPDDVNAAAIAFFGTDAEDEDFAAKLYGRCRTNGPIMLLWSGTVTLGAKLVTDHPITKTALTAYWADTITLTSNVEWLSDPTIRSEALGDTIAYLVLNLYGIKDVYLEVDLDGGSTTAASAYAIITGFKSYIDE